MGGFDGGFRDNCAICEMRGKKQPLGYCEPCQGHEEKGLEEDEVCTERGHFLPTQCISGLIPCKQLWSGLDWGLWVRYVLTPGWEHFHAWSVHGLCAQLKVSPLSEGTIILYTPLEGV